MDNVDFPPVTPGVKVLIQLREQNPNTGRSEVVPMTIKDSDECWDGISLDEYGSPAEAMHKSTICTQCIASWATDWYITLGDTPADLGFRS
jgi:hypothetical protein